MIGERENIYQDSNYGTLTMRPYVIDGNEINAFYDAQDNLVFVLDNTINSQKPNVLLVINPDGDKKWDEILSSEYGVDLETIRPKVDNKYQKLDIEYSGLGVYEALVNAYNAGDDLTEHLNQLAILRDSASRHSAMIRLNAANEIISKTNATIVKTKESIVRLETRIKTLRSKLSSAKKEIGRVNTKQSASKILKLESQIEATNEKLKRAKKRLDSAQKRLEMATVDAELASDLLNQPSSEIKPVAKTKPVVVAPEYPVQTVPAEKDTEIVEYKEDDEEYDDDDEDTISDDNTNEETEVKPLFDKDPQILNEDIAFKPISFDAPVFDDKEEQSESESLDFDDKIFETDMDEDEEENKPVLESITPIEEETTTEEEPDFIPEPILEEKAEIMEEKPISESLAPVSDVPTFTPEPVLEEEADFVEEKPEVIEEKPVLETIQPVPPVSAPAPVPPVSPVYQNQQPQTSFQIPAEVNKEGAKPGFVYYILLLLLILLSVFTLWLYQKNVSVKDTAPVLTVTAQENTIVAPKPEKVVEPEPVVVAEEENEDDTEEVFLDEMPIAEQPEPAEQPMVIEEEPQPEPVEQPAEEEPLDDEWEMPVDEQYEAEVEPEEPFVMDVVPSRLNTSGETVEEEQPYIMSEEEILASKPVFEPGAKYDEMFINEEDYVEPEPEMLEPDEDYYQNEEQPFVDEGLAEYQEESDEMYY